MYREVTMDEIFYDPTLPVKTMTPQEHDEMERQIEEARIYKAQQAFKVIDKDKVYRMYTDSDM